MQVSIVVDLWSFKMQDLLTQRFCTPTIRSCRSMSLKTYRATASAALSRSNILLDHTSHMQLACITLIRTSHEERNHRSTPQDDALGAQWLLKCTCRRTQGPDVQKPCIKSPKKTRLEILLHSRLILSSLREIHTINLIRCTWNKFDNWWSQLQ